MISKDAVSKFQQKFMKNSSVPVKDLIKLNKSSVDYLAGVAPKPKKFMKSVIKVSRKKLKNIPEYKEKQLKKVPKFIEIEVPVPKDVSPRTYLRTVEVPKVDFDEIDPWVKIIELLNKCDNAVLKNKLDFAEIYYGQIQPFYEQLEDNDKRFVFFKIKELQESIIELRMDRVKQLILITS